MNKKLTSHEKIILDLGIEDAIIADFGNSITTYKYLYTLAMAYIGDEEIQQMYHDVMSDHYARIGL